MFANMSVTIPLFLAMDIYELSFWPPIVSYMFVIGISNDAVIRIDESGMITHVNKSFEKILKYTQEEVYGKPITNIYDTIGGQKLSSYISMAKKNGIVTDMFGNMHAKKQR